MHLYFTFFPRPCSAFNRSSYLIPIAIHFHCDSFSLSRFLRWFLSATPSFFQYVCTLGVGISLTARHSLIIQRVLESTGSSEGVQGSSEAQGVIYLSIHPSTFTLCASSPAWIHRNREESHLSNVISKSAHANLWVWSRGGWLVALPMKETEWGHAGAGSSFSGIINSTRCSSTAGRGGVTG